MTRSKIPEGLFRPDAEPAPPEWQQIQDEEKRRRQALLEKQKTQRLARAADLALSKSAETGATKPNRRRKAG